MRRPLSLLLALASLIPVTTASADQACLDGCLQQYTDCLETAPLLYPDHDITEIEEMCTLLSNWCVRNCQKADSIKQILP